MASYPTPRSNNLPDKPTGVSIAGIVVGGIIAVLVLRAIVGIITGLLSLVIPLAIVAGGAYLVTTGRKGLGWAGVIVGLLILL